MSRHPVLARTGTAIGCRKGLANVTLPDRNFLATALNDAFGAHFVLTQIILPLGISFITFQKIAFLIDVHAGRIKSFTLREYAVFVLFFPQLIAGPIVHFREMMPQSIGRTKPPPFFRRSPGV